MEKTYKVVLLGAGNVATHLARAFCRVGHQVYVWNRSELPLNAISEELHCLCTTDMTLLPADADVFIIAVKDDAIPLVTQLLKEHIANPCGIVAHTAGSCSLGILQEYYCHCGVLYPMQTFSKQKQLDYSRIPFFIEEEGETLLGLAKTISPMVYRLNSEQRKHLHLASVFACNFVNHCYTIAEEVLRDINVPFSVLIPLIEETTDKVKNIPPAQAQTGPAVRKDRSVMDEHLRLLDDNKDLQQIYSYMSNSIIKHNND